jgi:hypothetical protein
VSIWTKALYCDYPNRIIQLNCALRCHCLPVCKLYWPTEYLRFWQQCCWRLSHMRLCCADWQIVTDIWKDCIMFICGVKQSKKSVAVQQTVIRLVVGGCCQAQCAWQRPPTTRPTAFLVQKTRGCRCSFRLLMMGGVLPETCWASYKYGIIKFWYTVAPCCIFSLWNELWWTGWRGVKCWSKFLLLAMIRSRITGKSNPGFLYESL